MLFVRQSHKNRANLEHPDRRGLSLSNSWQTMPQEEGEIGRSRSRKHYNHHPKPWWFRYGESYCDAS
jgi:hypothetical protein